MPETATRATVDVEQLNERLNELERRVAELEGGTGTSAPNPAVATSTLPRAAGPQRPPATWRGFPSPESGGAVPVMGKAVLAVAGAYLFRALAEVPSVPKLPVLFLAICYAALWMVLGLKTYAVKNFTGVTYAVTSVAILCPLLWEATVRFGYLAASITGAVLVGFVVLTVVRSWPQKLEVLPWIAVLAAILTTIALIVATHALLPLTCTLLAICLVTEVSSWLGHALSFRALPPLATAIALLLVLDIMTSPDGVPPGYSVLSPAMLTTLSLVFFAIYGGTVLVQAFIRGKQLTLFEIPLALLAFLVSTFGAMRATQGKIETALQLIFLLMSSGCFLGALRRFTLKDHTRNHVVFAAWGVFLLIGGSYAVPGGMQVVLLCASALAAFYYFERTSLITVGAASSILLVAAGVASSLVAFVVDTMSGPVPAAPGYGVWIVAIASLVCYAIAVRFPDDEQSRRWLSLVPAVLTTFTAAACLVAIAVWFAGGRADITPSRLSVIRTIVNCAMAMALAVLGSRKGRAELRWLAYAAVGFGTLKLVVEDLRFGNALSLVFSLLFYGLILILLPRFTGRDRTSATVAAVPQP